MMTPDTETLLNRIIDGEESSHDWRAFAGAADQMPGLWRQLAEQQRQSRLLSLAVRERVEQIGVDATTRAGCDAVGQRRHEGHEGHEEQAAHGAHGARGADGAGSGDMQIFTPRPGSWIGWAVAACLLVAWGITGSFRIAPGSAGSSRGEGDPSTAAGSAAGDTGIVQASFANPADALQSYIDLGRRNGTVVGEVPGKPLVEKQPLESGDGYVVFYYRLILERREVPGFIGFDQADENGFIIPGLVPGSAPTEGSAPL